MAGGGSGEEADYWPGYVDALTAMVKVLAFVMMLLAVAVFVLSQNVSRQIVQQLAEAADVKPDETATTEQIVAQVRAKITASRTPPDTPSTPRPTPPAASTDQTPETRVESQATDTFVPQTAVQAVASGTKMVIGFPDRVTRVDADAISKLAEFIKPMAASGRNFVVVAYADISANALTEARRIAYFRAMQLRGQILSNGFKPENVTIQVLDIADQARGRTAEVVAR